MSAISARAFFSCRNWKFVALILVAFNWVACPVLWILTRIRLVRFPKLLMLSAPARAVATAIGALGPGRR